MSLTIHVLGPLVIKSDDCRLDKLPKKARALLAFLAAQSGEAVSRERLADSPVDHKSFGQTLEVFAVLLPLWSVLIFAGSVPHVWQLAFLLQSFRRHCCHRPRNPRDR